MNYIAVYNLHSEKLASKIADFMLPLEVVKNHFRQKGSWKDTHSIQGFDGYALINEYLYGFKIVRPSV